MFLQWQVCNRLIDLDIDCTASWQDTGHVFSSELDATVQTPIARLYRHDTNLCWEAPYKAATGYGVWVATNTGPLGVNCGSISSAAWYTKANAMNNGTTYTAAASISSGYMGITHMVHQTGNNIVVGGEIDGRTLSAWLSKGKPMEGEVYLVSTSNSEETLIASTETSVQAQLWSATAVDPGTVGGLTGSSAQTLQSTLGTFTSLWLNSESASIADAHGLVTQRCPATPSATTASRRKGGASSSGSTTSGGLTVGEANRAELPYIALGCKNARDTGFSIDVDQVGKSEQAIGIQRLTTTSSDVQILLVCHCSLLMHILTLSIRSTL